MIMPPCDWPLANICSFILQSLDVQDDPQSKVNNSTAGTFKMSDIDLFPILMESFTIIFELNRMACGHF
jgi:hypothetical protein